jgi:hypothetical protein
MLEVYIMKQLKLLGLFTGIFVFIAGNLQAQSVASSDSASLSIVKDSSSVATVKHQSTSIADNATSEKQSAINNKISEGNNNEFEHKICKGDIEYTPVGYGGLEVGQIASGYFRYPGQSNIAVSHVWQQRAYSSFGYEALIKKSLEINIIGGGLLAYSTPQIGGNPQTQQSRYFFYLKDASASYHIYDSDVFSLKAQVGYFPFKYNPDVRNLGEYLFRTNAYPLLVYSDFDNPQADILGLRVNCQLNPSENCTIKNDLFLHSELYSVPVQDWSLSDVVSATVFKSLTIGGGVSFCNLLSVYQGTYLSDWLEYNYKNGFYITDSEGDSVKYDWQSTKVMGRLSFDPKIFIPTGIFGKNDLILYGEADIIGTKNYPRYFTNMNDRIFYSLGFNIPGFKLFDVINGEIEYCSDTSAFSDEGLYTASSNLSMTSIKPQDLASGTSKIKRNPYRWSAYIKKSILDGHVSFIAQCARDHKKINFYYYLRNRMSLMESLPTKNDWWWSFKTEFNF